MKIADASFKVAAFRKKAKFLINTGTTVHGLQACKLKRSSLGCPFQALNLKPF